MVPIRPMKNDDERFLALVSRVTFATILDFRPDDVFLVRIDHWFDHKWLGFSGKALGAVGVYKRRLTIPPFRPRRVVSQHAYTFDAAAGFYRLAQTPSLHGYRPSSTNMTTFIDRAFQSAALIWFSGGTAVAEHGSLMIYTNQPEAQSGWYASFRRDDDWRLHKVRGLSRAEFDSRLSGEESRGRLRRRWLQCR